MGCVYSQVFDILFSKICKLEILMFLVDVFSDVDSTRDLILFIRVCVVEPYPGVILSGRG